MKVSKGLALLMAGMLMLSVVACGKSETLDDFSIYSEDEVSVSAESEVGGEGTGEVSGDSGKKTTTAKNQKKKTTTTTKKKSGDSGAIQKDVQIEKGTKAMDEGLNFGGKTFVMGINPTDEYKRAVKAFEKKFNCKITYDGVDFDQFIPQISARVASGKQMDISVLHGSKFPAAVIANLYEPLQSGFTTADYYNASNPKAGGIDIDRSNFYMWNNNCYAVCNHDGLNSVSSGFVFYNKKILKAAGCDDPRTIYNKNPANWTWDKMKEIGKKVTNPDTGVYLGKQNLVLFSMVSANGGSYVVNDGNTPKENMSDSRIFNALKYMQDICSGTGKIIDMDDYSADGESFFSGKHVFYSAAEYNYWTNFNIAEGVLKSNAFGKSLDNLGMVPFPKGPDNASGKSGIGGWLEGWGVVKGSKDIRVCLAWVKFISAFQDPVKPKYQYSAEDQALLDKMSNEKVQYNNLGFADSTDTAYNYLRKMEEAIAYGGDIAQNISDYRKIVSNCIKVTLSQQ